MKKSLLALLMAFVLVITFAVPASGAGKFRDKLSELKDKIQSAYGSEEENQEEYVLERLVMKLIGLVEEQCRENGVDPSQLLEQLLAQFTDEDGNFDVSTLLFLIEMLTSGETDLEAEPSEELDIPAGSYLEQMFRRDDMIRQHVADEYQDTLGAGDVQIITLIISPNEADEMRYVLGYFSISNFTVEGKDLKLQNYAGNVEYLEIAVDDDMNFELAEVIPADKENYSDSIGTLCEKYGEDRESFDYRTDDQHKKWEELFDMISFLEDHPEYERMEYEGEMRTLDELTTIYDDVFDAIMEGAFALAE